MLQQLAKKMEEFKSKSPMRRAWKSGIHFLGVFLVASVAMWMLLLICKLIKHTIIYLGNGIVGINT